jgi:hypothetical protein
MFFPNNAACAVCEGLSAEALAAHEKTLNFQTSGRRSSCASTCSDLSELLASEFSYSSLDLPSTDEIILATVPAKRTEQQLATASMRSYVAQSCRTIHVSTCVAQGCGTEPPTPMAQIALAVASVRAALVSDDSVMTAEVEEGPRGWSVTAHVAHELSQFDRERILQGAQQALLFANDSSKDTCLLRFRRSPFVLMPWGFGASLSVMSDMSSPCLRLFEQGFCNAKRCRFQHPESKVGVTVLLKAAGASRA